MVLNTTLGMKLNLKNVKFIQYLKRILISVGQIDGEGHHVTFGDHRWKVTKVDLVVGRGQKWRTLYMVEVFDDEAHVVKEFGASTLWYQRLVHMSEKGMKMLSSKGRISNPKKVIVDFFEPCVLGKQKKVTFTNIGHPPKTGKLELVHSDVYGPTSFALVGGSRYYVTFIDDYTRKV